MYLATLKNLEGLTYQLRISTESAPHRFNHHVVFNLGPDPQKHFEIYAEQTVIFSQELLDTVDAYNVKNPDLVLEQLLFDFFPAYIQKKIKNFQTHREYKSGPLSSLEKEAIQQQIHIFDRKRLYYLRYGAVDQSRLSNLHEKCCRPLLGISRDEKEFYFQAEEKALKPGMYLQYIYAIFDLRKFFDQSFAAWMPEALQKDQIGEHFLGELCRLNADKDFWQQSETLTSSLHFHLQRYVIMFFDFAATPRSFFEDFSKSFQEQFRNFKWPERKSTCTPDELADIFETDYESLIRMSKEKLGKLYRKKTMKFHPDQGGDHDKFIKLTEAYQQLKDRQ